MSCSPRDPFERSLPKKGSLETVATTSARTRFQDPASARSFRILTRGQEDGNGRGWPIGVRSLERPFDLPSLASERKGFGQDSFETRTIEYASRCVLPIQIHPSTSVVATNELVTDTPFPPGKEPIRRSEPFDGSPGDPTAWSKGRWRTTWDASIGRQRAGVLGRFDDPFLRPEVPYPLRCETEFP